MATPEQRAIYQNYVKSITRRKVGELPFNVDDHITRLQIAERLNTSISELAKALGVPVEYLWALRASMKR